MSDNVFEVVHRFYLDVLFALINVLADVIIVLVFAKHRRLLSNKANVFIMHFAVADALYVISVPITTRLLYLYFKEPGTYLFLSGLSFVLLAATVGIMLMFLLRWYLRLYHSDSFGDLDRNVNAALFGLYIMIAVCAIPLTWYYVHNYTGLCLLIFYGVCLLFLDVNHVCRKDRLVGYNFKKDCQLFLANAFFLPKIPYCIDMILMWAEVIVYVEKGGFVGTLILYLTSLVASMIGVYFLIILYIFDTDFKRCLNVSLGRSIRPGVNEHSVERGNETIVIHSQGSRGV